MKKAIKVYLDSEDIPRLISKARESGFKGRGSLSHFFTKIANEQIVFLSQDVKALVSLLVKNGDE